MTLEWYWEPSITQGNSAAEAYKAGLEEMKKPEPNMQVAVLNQLFRIIYSPEHGPDMSDKLDNDKIGVPLMTNEQVKAVVKSCMA